MRIIPKTKLKVQANNFKLGIGIELLMYCLNNVFENTKKRFYNSRAILSNRAEHLRGV